MYALTLIYVLSENYKVREIIGVFSDQQQCELVSQTYMPRTQCYFLDPDKGLLDVGSPGITDIHKNSDNSDAERP